MLDLSTISKAIAAGIVSALVALAARYGFQPSAQAINASSVVLTALVGYAVGHVMVYFAPKNKA